MRAVRGRPSLQAMTTRSRRTLTLELDDGPTDSIGGRLSNEAGEAIEFTGWLGLAGALEAALQGAPARSVTAADTEATGNLIGTLHDQEGKGND
jgi:hypothetical protein